MIATKILFNSAISRNGDRFMTIDISNFYLMKPLKRPEYTRIHVRDIPDKIIKKYKLKKKRRKGCGIYPRQPRHVWLTAVRTTIQQAPWKATEQTRLPRKQTITRPLETVMDTNTIKTSGRQFWRKISGRETCTPPQTNTRRKLKSHDRVVRHKVHRNHTRLGL